MAEYFWVFRPLTKNATWMNIGADFHRAMMTAASGETLLIGRRSMKLSQVKFLLFVSIFTPTDLHVHKSLCDELNSNAVADECDVMTANCAIFVRGLLKTVIGR
jgi:hypothetical protein